MKIKLNIPIIIWSGASKSNCDVEVWGLFINWRFKVLKLKFSLLTNVFEKEKKVTAAEKYPEKSQKVKAESVVFKLPKKFANVMSFDEIEIEPMEPE